MEYLIGILLLISFFGLVVYAVRGGNLMLGIFVMGVIWTVLPMIGNTFVTNPDFIAANKDAISISWIDALTSTFQSGPEGWGATLVNVIFGAWFGRVLMNTGIASTLIRTTTELGGDKPALNCILLCVVNNSMVLIHLRCRCSRGDRRHRTSDLYVSWNSEGACDLCIHDERWSRNVCQSGTVRTVFCVFP